MKSDFPDAKVESKGSALIITLLIVVLVTIVVVGYLSSVMFETKVAWAALNKEKANNIATFAMHSAVAQVREALGSGTNSWDNPYGNFSGSNGKSSPPAFYWSVSPGLLTRWEYSSSKYTGGVATYANLPAINKYPLFSGTSFSISGTLGPTVNLNRQKADGTYPIISSSTTGSQTSAPPVSVQWVNLLGDPSNAAASGTNQIVARYAFWVDDENSKININTADGTSKNDASKSLGLGSPTEVSLQVLTGSSGQSLSGTTAAAIVQIARTMGFHSAQEIQRVPGVSADIYTSNVFNLTAASRSPDLNVFGHPKIALIPAENYDNGKATAELLRLNYITLQPLREIYPTPLQLNTLTFNYLDVTKLIESGTKQTKTGSNILWPTAFAQARPTQNDYDKASGPYTYNLGSNLSCTAVLLLTDYLAGKNPAGDYVYTWPAFPGSTATSFLQEAASVQTGTSPGPGKYSARQIDSIAAQIHDLAAKSTSSDFYHTDPYISTCQQTNSAPTVTPGFLSAQYVSGMGRSPKVEKLLLKLTTQGSVTTTGTDGRPIYTPPEVEINTWLEWWLPAHYQGVNLWYKTFNSSGQGLREGNGNLWDGCLNLHDHLALEGSPYLDSSNHAAAPQVWTGGPQSWGGDIPRVSSGTDFYNNYWADQLLSNNQGIDLAGNPQEYPDPDQTLAQQYHPYLMSGSDGSAMSGAFNVSWSSSTYMGSSPYVNISRTQPATWPALMVRKLYSNSTTGDWAPGEIRCPGTARQGYKYKMSDRADGSALVISGGLASTSAIEPSSQSEADPAPLDAMFTGSSTASGTTVNPITGTTTYSYNPMMKIDAINPGTANSSIRCLRDRLIAAVIPMAGSVSVPDGSSDGLSANTLYIYAHTLDPLVNKFPGDWITTASSGNPTSLSGTQFNPDSKMENPTIPICQPDPFTGWYDPDSYWMPTMDSSLYQGTPPTMPRCARFPSIGYLQYIRTGIIPDDENLTYKGTGSYSNSIQHGTPYRLLNFGPSYDPSDASMSTSNSTQKTSNPKSFSYPDWAMLDLVYIPSMLLAYGSPYTSYADQVITPGSVTVNNSTIQSVTVAYKNAAVVHNMYSYGTYGGATSGRINPNGAVIYTTDVMAPAKDTSGNYITRTVPLQALLHGLSINQNLLQAGSGTYNWQGGSAVDEAAVANAIAGYIERNGPLRLPSEICNVREIAATAPTGGGSAPYPYPVNNPTRNDLVREIVGNLTTQSNTFSIWVAGQVVQKNKTNTKYGEFETGDRVLSEVRYHYIVERYLDPGADGVYGNLAQSGTDGVVGTVDDLSPYLDPPKNLAQNSSWPNHPPNPRYLYRVISSEEVR